MSDHVQLGDVNTWWDVHGEGEPLALLHPGGGDSRAYDLNLPGLSSRLRSYRFGRRGSGRTPDVDGPITFELMAHDTIALIETVVGEPCCLRVFRRARMRPRRVSRKKRGTLVMGSVRTPRNWPPGHTAC